MACEDPNCGPGGHTHSDRCAFGYGRAPDRPWCTWCGAMPGERHLPNCTAQRRSDQTMRRHDPRIV